jgi:hypothetical protein
MLLTSLLEHDVYLKSMLEIIAWVRIIRGITLQLNHNVHITVLEPDCSK